MWKICNVVAPYERARAIFARSVLRKARGGVDHHHRADRESNRDDPGRLTEPELENQQRHQGEHGRGDQNEDIRRHDFFHKGELGDERGQENARDSSDCVTQAQFLKRNEQVRPQERKGPVERGGDLARQRKDVGRDVPRANQEFGSRHDDQRHPGDRSDLYAGETH